MKEQDCKIIGENKARVPMIWPQQCCDSDECKEAGKQNLEYYGTQLCRTGKVRLRSKAMVYPHAVDSWTGKY